MVNRTKQKIIISILFLFALFFSLIFLFYDIKPNIFVYTMNLRIPKYLTIIICSVCIAYATHIFQVITSNIIITPALLGMNSLYTLTNTTIVFFLGTSSIVFINDYYSYIISLIFMSLLSFIIYGYLFDKANYNILIILLIGTIITNLFNSFQQSMVRIMDPNEYDSLLSSLISSFNNVNSKLLFISSIMIILILLISYKDIKCLDVLNLGKNNAINLGINFNIVSRRLLITVSLLIAISTALVGPITFLGLIIVNISRELMNSFRSKYIIISSILLSIILLLIAQILVENVFVFSIPISVIINLIGGIYFLILLMKERGKM